MNILGLHPHWIWKLPHLVDANMCAFGMTSCDDHGTGYIYKPITFMTNSSYLARELDRKCNKTNRRAHLVNGRAKQAAIYSDELCDSIGKDIRSQIDHDILTQRLPKKIVHSLAINILEIHNDEPDAKCFYDDVSGAALDPKLVRKARRVEMDLFYKRGVYYYDTVGNSYKLTGNKNN